MYISQFFSKCSSFAVDTILMLMLMLCLMSGCGAVIVAGAGAGTYTYVSGKITRTYSAGYQETINACIKVLNKKELEIIAKSEDALRTKIESKRHDDTNITIEIEEIGSNLSRVAIRTGLVGVDKKTESELMHEQIYDEIKKSVTTVEIISPTSYKVEISPDIAEPPADTGPQEENVLYLRKQGETAENTDIIENAEQTALPSNPLYIFYNDQEIEIPQSSLAQIKSIVDFLRKKSSSTIDIKSYTDSHGAAEDNLNLSWKRANVLKDYLMQQGISFERITTRGFGASNYLWSNSTETLRKLNRRTVLYINQ
ncbi:MAG: DUF3568 family protein [Desulfobacterales bacterium]|nr:DUF3568 family protein [Desulfobacterales bacterium]